MIKQTAIIALIFSAIIIAACAKTLTTRIFKIRNDTNYPIKISCYKTYDKAFRNVIDIESKQEYSSEAIKDKRPNLYMTTAFLDFPDSIVITYNNTKKAAYVYGNPRDKNLFNQKSFNISEVEKYKAVHVFTFTEADYNAATDCNGKCE